MDLFLSESAIHRSKAVFIRFNGSPLHRDFSVGNGFVGSGFRRPKREHAVVGNDAQTETADRYRRIITAIGGGEAHQILAFGQGTQIHKGRAFIGTDGHFRSEYFIEIPFFRAETADG